jgi:transposase, IS6 family
VDHVTACRRVQRFTPEFIEAARPCRHAPGDRWLAGEAYLKAAGRWTYLYRAAGQHGQVTDVLLSARRGRPALPRPGTARWHGSRRAHDDRAPACPRVLDELVPSALHTVKRHANNPVEAGHGWLKARLRPMCGLRRHRPGRVLPAGHALVQNLRRGHYETSPQRSRAATGSASRSTTSPSPSDRARHRDHAPAHNATGRHNATVPSWSTTKARS